jgi:hypothetical protein
LPQPVPVPDIGITPDWKISFGDKTFITQNLSASKIKFVQERRFDKLTISEIEKFCMLNGIRLPRKNSLKDDYVKIMIKTFSQNN